ncbi:putative Calnexin 1 [Paratrimastix pyriformis]|uniref:Calnexin 1 n=1 Tax=Paratrimastix pyriformis TaxID=342808 RepID=A0ABQ8UFE8_9EUKA|nr:putative Calnexin 1 [Paratrimastix pyriformis]
MLIDSVNDDMEERRLLLTLCCFNWGISFLTLRCEGDWENNTAMFRKLCVFALLSLAFAEVFFQEEFNDGWDKRWVKSSLKGEQQGEWTHTAGEFYGDKDAQMGIKASQDARFYGISADMGKTISNKDQDLIVSYTVKHEQKIDCGGGYMKLMPAPLNQEKFGGDDKYNIMFGPDICGTGTRKVHAIFNYKGQNLLIKKNVPCKTDQLTHLYTLIVHPDNTYEIQIDEEKVQSGKLEEDWDFLKPKEIADPEAKKPADWVDDAQIPDVNDKKPEGWDQPQTITDPEATKPETWDDEADGEWVAPQVPNPEYKGEWKQKMIPNPNYKGPWKAPMIPNPEYTPDDKLYLQDGMRYVGIEIWQVKAGTIFDNIIVANDMAEVKAFTDRTWKANKDAEKAKFDKAEEERRKVEEEQRKVMEEQRKKDEEEKKKEEAAHPAAPAEEEDEDDEEEEEKKPELHDAVDYFLPPPHFTPGVDFVHREHVLLISLFVAGGWSEAKRVPWAGQNAPLNGQHDGGHCPPGSENSQQNWTHSQLNWSQPFWGCARMGSVAFSFHDQQLEIRNQYALAGTCRSWKTIMDSEEYWAQQSKLFRAEPPAAMRQHPNFSWKLYFRHSVTIDRSFPTLRENDLRYSPSGRSCECVTAHPDWGSLVLNRRFKEAAIWLAFAGQTDADKWRAGFMLEPIAGVVAGQDKTGWGHWCPSRGPAYPNRVALGLGIDKDHNLFAQVRMFSFPLACPHAVCTALMPFALPSCRLHCPHAVCTALMPFALPSCLLIPRCALYQSPPSPPPQSRFHVRIPRFARTRFPTVTALGPTALLCNLPEGPHAGDCARGDIPRRPELPVWMAGGCETRWWAVVVYNTPPAVVDRTPLPPIDPPISPLQW